MTNKILNLNDFLKNDTKNFINIYFDEQYFNSIFEGFNFQDFKGRWLFFKKDTELSLISVDSSYNFILDNQNFNLIEYGNILYNAYIKWQIDFPDLIFPNFMLIPNNYIHGHGSSVSYNEQKDNHLIFITLDDLKSIEQFKFVVGHELGHIYFRKKLSLNYLIKNFNLKNPLFPKEILIITLCTLILNWYTYFINEKLASFILLFWSFLYLTYFLLAFCTSSNRYYNYSMEFFCDFFAYYFFKNDSLNSDFLREQGNVITHPSGKLRKLYNKNFKFKNLNEWTSPVKGIFFRIPSILEIIIILDNILDRIRIKMKS